MSDVANDLVASAWSVGLIGLCASSILFGVSLAQAIHYFWYFPNDSRCIKSVVFVVFIADCLHLVSSSQSFWALLVVCHRSSATMCVTDLPWGASIGVAMTYIITVSVQCFYCHRVWIVTGNNIIITAIVLITAVLPFALGTWTVIETIKEGTIKYLYTTPLVPIVAAMNTVCDVIITTTIFKYLWRSELRGRSHIIRDLVVVFINMGALTCLISITVGVVYLAQSNHYWVGAPGVVLARCYVNSLLAVLNMRRIIRERELRQFHYTIEMPTLPTIH